MLTRQQIIIVSIATGVLLIIYAVFNPLTNHLFPQCPFYRITGWYCPGCGSQRCAHELLNGNISKAAADNLLFILFLPMLLLVAFTHLYYLLLNKKIHLSFLYHPLLPKLIVVVVLVFWILRNIPLYPFSLLAPSV